MIDRITITVDDAGFWQINGGDVFHARTTSIHDLLLEVKHLSGKLMFIPVSPLPLDPIPFDSLPHQVFLREKREDEKERKARQKAEKHLDELRRDKVLESALPPPPTHKQEQQPGIPNGQPATSQADKGTGTATSTPAKKQLTLF